MKDLHNLVKPLLLMCLLSVFFSGGAKASTYTAASCNWTDVNAAINGPTHVAADGDVIQIPAGSCTWTSGITVPSHIGITIIGAGSNSTTITDNLKSGPLFLANPLYGNSTTRISSMTLAPFLPRSGYSQPIQIFGTCTVLGCPNVRIDNLNIPATWSGIGIPADSFSVIHNCFGVLDHNNVGSGSGGGGNGVDFVNVGHGGWQGIGQYGDSSWASPSTFGTNQALYIENNTFGNAFATDTDIVSTTGGGGRYVCRFNTFNSVTLAGACANHGTESPGRARGGRQTEAYNNTFVCTNTSAGCATGIMIRSGVYYVFDNTFIAQNSSWFNNYVNMVEYRTYASFNVWGLCAGAGGSGIYDGNDGASFYSGTYTGTSGSTSFADANQAWNSVFGSTTWASDAANAGNPYSIWNATQNFGAEISSSSGNNLTFRNNPNCNWGSGTQCTWSAGDSYKIVRSSFCIDQSGRSGGVLLSGITPGPIGSVNQTLEPNYEWGDTHSGSFFGTGIGINTAKFLANRDFYKEVSQSAQTSQTSPFNGTQGTGFGTMANRPPTCAQGVAYWATDQGNWNQSGGGQGALYVCGAAGWPATPSYSPYTYPHPLVAGGSAGTGGTTTPNPPTGLAVTVQ